MVLALFDIPLYHLRPLIPLCTSVSAVTSVVKLLTFKNEEET